MPSPALGHLEVGYLLAATFEEHGFYEVRALPVAGGVFFSDEVRYQNVPTKTGGSRGVRDPRGAYMSRRFRY